ncbi:MAG: hypothetical protein QXG65_00830 [Thermoplasmata archaeon]
MGDKDRWFRYASLVALAICWVTIILGGNVIANDSGLGCSTWPSCDGTFFPPLTGAMGIEWIHRLSALVLAVSIAVLAGLAVAYERRRPALLRLSVGSLVVVGILALLGAAVVDSSLALGLVLLHFAVATILFGMLLILALIANWSHLPRRWIEWARRVEGAPEGPSSGRARPSSPPPPPEWDRRSAEQGLH